MKLVVLITGILAVAPAMAHHSFAAEFDFKKPVAPNVANAREVELADGRKVFARSEYTEGEAK